MSLRVSLGKSGRGLLLGKVCFARESNFKEVILPLFQTKVEIFSTLVFTRDVRGEAFFCGAGRGGARVKIRGAVRGGAGRKSA